MDENTREKLLMIKAMEFIARRINCEGCFENWKLCIGISEEFNIPDDLNIYQYDNEKLEYFLNNENFADLMDSFLFLMSNTYFCKGLRCAEVTSKAKTNRIPS